MTQPTQTHGPKQALPRPGTVETPLGPARIEESLIFDDVRWGFETDGLACPTAFGCTSASFELGGRVGEPIPTVLSLVFRAGAEGFGTPAGEPIVRNEGKVAWHASLPLDPITGLPAPGKGIRVGLYEFDPPPERRILGTRPRDVRDPALMAEVEAECARIVETWAKAQKGYAARIYAALLRSHQVDAEAAVEATRKAYLAASDIRTEIARLARAAEQAAAGRFEPRPLRITATPESPRPHVELRGFSGRDALDPLDLDEVLVAAPEFFHLETMSDSHVWMGIYLGDGRRLAVNVHAKASKASVCAEFDDDGLD